MRSRSRRSAGLRGGRSSTRSTRSPVSTKRRSRKRTPPFELTYRARAGEPELLPLPPGVVDRMFMHELALELGMPVGEMCRRMSAHELAVEWPAFFRMRAREEADRRDAEEG